MQRKNRISSPSTQSPSSGRSDENKKPDVIELFTIKQQQMTPKPKSRKCKANDVPPALHPSSDFSEDNASELSDEVFVVKLPQRFSPESVHKSDTNKSYREKINERFKNIKEKAGKSTKNVGRFKETAERLVVERVRRESDSVDAEYQLAKIKFKLGQSSQLNNSYEFFCSEQSKDGTETDSQQGEIEKSPADNANMEDGNEGAVVEYSHAEMLTFNVKVSERDLLFKPNSKPVDIEDKIDGAEPRYLEDEGLYISKLPKVPPEHVNLLESRLVCDRKWFNCEGKLDILEGPVVQKSSRPYVGITESDETTFYSPPTTISNELEEVVVIRENILQIQLLSLKFTHHPLFSLEHVYEQKLRRLFDEYERRRALNNFIRLNQKLSMIRQSQNKTGGSGDSSSSKNMKKVKNSTHMMRKLREQIFQEGRQDRELVKQILQTWKLIKDIRARNNYSNTSVKLIIKKQKVDYEAEKQEYDRKFDEFYYDLIAEEKEHCKRRQNYNIDEDEIRRELQERFNDCFKPPGEPVVDFELNSNHEITRNVENPKEIARRKAVASTKVSLKVLCNKVDICKTKNIELSDNFLCHVNECIDIQLANAPATLTMEVSEQPTLLAKKILGEITLTVPRKNISIDTMNVSEEAFEAKEIVRYKHEGVGSGISLQDVTKTLAKLEQDDGEEELRTSGSVSFTMGWQNASKEELPEVEMFTATEEINRVVTKNGSVDPTKLHDWLQTNKPDPQDPRNLIFYEYSLMDEEPIIDISNSNKSFRLNPYLQGFQFCNIKVIEENTRLKILKLRDRNEPEFDQMCVPNRLKEIPMNILEDYYRRINSESKTNMFEENDEQDEIEKRRINGRKNLKQIYIKVFQMCKNTENNLTFDDVVNEKFLLHFQTLLTNMAGNFIKWFRWRPLKLSSAGSQNKPTSEATKSLDRPTTAVVSKLKVNIISGINIPELVKEINKSDPNTRTEVKPFVEVQYNNTTARSRTSSGANPVWNEELCMSLEPSHMDYLNPNSLRGSVLINLFDEQDKELNKFGGEKGRTWLGYLEIPLSSVCYNGVNGLFKIKLPHLLLGYETMCDKNTKSPKKTNQTEVDTCLNLQLTVEPIIPKLTPSIEELPCNELPFIKDYTLCWNRNYNTNYPHRKFSVFAIDTNAKTVCIVRYIKPVEPPQINVEGFDVTPEQCARFVSLIPFTDCNQFYQNVWITVDQLLHLMIGSIIDHAVALTCYLLALKLEVWLLLGQGTITGSTAFVLVREYSNSNNQEIMLHYIYDVVSGEKYSTTDNFCPLLKTYCVVNENNIWANIQRTDNLALTRFDFNRKSDWLPLFNNKNLPPTNSVQNKINYLPVAEVGELEITIDRKIRRKIGKLRPMDRTLWNRHISNAFKTALSLFESNVMFGKSHAETMVKLNNYMLNFRVRGYVINLPFTTVSSIMKTTRALGIHMQEDSNIEFASAVHVKSYPNQVLSLWIFLACVQQDT